jgi:hypothetical protein
MAGDDKLDTLIEDHLATMMTVDSIKDDVKKLKDKYEYDRDNAKSEAEKEAFKAKQQALADGLPGITKGTLSAIDAFGQDPPDNIAGCAAIMDICSSLATTLGGLSISVGPAGAVVGALFSMVSMILNFFAPKPPSLLDQIEAFIKDLDAENKKCQIEATGDLVAVYAKSGDKFMETQDPSSLTDLLQQAELIQGNIITNIRTVQAWLKEGDHPELKGWPEILNLHCQVYMHLWLAVTRQHVYANDPKTMEKYVGKPAEPKKEPVWEKLQQKSKTVYTELLMNDLVTSQFMNQIVPVARKRGLYVIAHAGGWMNIATGPKVFNEYKCEGVFEHCGGMSINPPRGGVKSAKAQYDVVVWDY